MKWGVMSPRSTLLPETNASLRKRWGPGGKLSVPFSHVEKAFDIWGGSGLEGDDGLGLEQEGQEVVFEIPLWFQAEILG